VRTRRRSGAKTMASIGSARRVHPPGSSITDGLSCAVAMKGGKTVPQQRTLPQAHVEPKPKGLVVRHISAHSIGEDAAAAGNRGRFQTKKPQSGVRRGAGAAARASLRLAPEAVTAVPKNIYGVTRRPRKIWCKLFAPKSFMRATCCAPSRFFSRRGRHPRDKRGHTDATSKPTEFLYPASDIEGRGQRAYAAADSSASARFREILLSATRHLAPDAAGTAQTKRALSFDVTCRIMRPIRTGAVGR